MQQPATALSSPVVDVTHPAFTLDIDEAKQRELVEKFQRDGIPFSRLPFRLRNLLLRFLLKGSILAGGIRKAQGGFMTGMHTYLLKLGPEMLGSAYANPVDRKIAASLPPLGVRLRLQDMALLMAEAMLPHLQADPRRPVVFLNIAGGPAVDSLNALIVLNKRHAGILTGRRISIVVLDAGDEGPFFGDAALAALSGTEGPLRGVDVNFQHSAYDWANADQLEVPLREALSQGALVICSSEGGLFEYGSDDEIVANLAVLRAHSSVVAVVGSVTRADELAQRLRQTGGAATVPEDWGLLASWQGMQIGVSLAWWNARSAIKSSWFEGQKPHPNAKNAFRVGHWRHRLLAIWRAHLNRAIDDRSR